MEDIMWMEKYRPETFDEVVGQEHIVDKLEEDTRSPLAMPHYLFESKSPGTGKTTLAKVIMNEIGANDVLELNASDDRGIDVIRERIKPFASSQRTDEDTPRVVFLDEADGLTSQAQDSLRNLMEKYSENCKFVMTCNHKDKIIQPIISRCADYSLAEPPKDEVVKRLQEICDSEEIEYDSEGLEAIVDEFYPDMRYMINELQKLEDEGVTADAIEERENKYDQLYDMMTGRITNDDGKRMSPFDIRQFEIEEGLNASKAIKHTLDRIEDDDELKRSRSAMTNIIKQASKREYRASIGADEELQLFGFIADFMNNFDGVNR